ncbi:MAG: biopolymer transporter ExbD [Nitrospirae bacterium]|nr:biopolymer transporter ExbD [Nitrospirota bacterium]
MKINRERGSLSDINITPFVDVMLVLLIIFMVTAPMMKQGLDINLPKTKGAAIKSDEDRFTVTIKKNHEIYLNKEGVTLPQLFDKLKASSTVNTSVFLEADGDVSYGLVAEVMGEIKAAGIDKIGMVTLAKELTK